MKTHTTPAPEVGQIWKTDSTGREFTIHAIEKHPAYTMYHCEYNDGGRFGLGSAWFDGTSGYSFVKSTDTAVKAI